MRAGAGKICRVLPVFLMALFFVLCVNGYARAETVVFECEDIGVEARRLLSRLKEEQKAFSRRQSELERRENELKILQAEVDKKLDQLKALREQMEQVLSKMDRVEKEKVKKLSKIYQKRNPADAAASLAAMEKDLAVSVLSMMRDKYAGEILDHMETETAVEYSTALGRPGR